MTGAGMADAYTIGITLALEDGISAGLAVIEAELDSLGRSADTLEARLLQARALAAAGMEAGLAAVAPPEPRLSGPAPALPPPAEVMLAPAQDVRVLAAAPVAALAPEAAPLAPAPVAPAIMPAAAVTVLPAPGTPDFVGAAPARETITKNPIPQVLAMGPAVMPAGVVDPPAEAAPPLIIPAAPSFLSAPAAAPAPSMAGLPPPQAVREAAPVSIPALPSVTIAPVVYQRTAAPREAGAADRPVYSPQALAPAPVTRPASAVPAGDTVAWRAVASVVPVAAPLARQEAAAGPAMGQTAGEKAPSRDEPSLQSGEIKFDGDTLGRWMLEHVSDELSRPPGGASLFDPRITPRWPGAPVTV
jgi:hypothetical protein